MHLWTWLCLTNASKLLERKYQVGFGEIILGQNPQTFMIPIYSTTVLYDTFAKLILLILNCLTEKF